MDDGRAAADDAGQRLHLEEVPAYRRAGVVLQHPAFQVCDLPGSRGAEKLLLAFLHLLADRADNQQFSADRAKNIVDGYTAAYVVTLAGDLVLVYNLGIQSSATAPSHQAMLNSGHKEEYAQLKRRIAAVLGLAGLPF